MQWGVLLHVQLRSYLNGLGGRELRFGLGQLPFGLVERRLEGPRIDLEEQLTLSDEWPFLITLFQQVSRDLRPDVSID
jgi:hypothetical protein